MKNIVQRHLWQSYIYMTLVTLFIVLLGSFISNSFHLGLSGTGVFILVAGIINFFAFYYSDRLVLAASQAQNVTKRQAPDLYKIVEKLCRENNLPMPKLYFIDEDAMNAFATGRNEKHAAVVVTRGLLEKLTEKEVESVIAHELSHIKNSDMKIMAVSTMLVGVLSIFADLFWRANMISEATDQDKSGVLSIVSVVLAIFTPISATLIKLAISRKREYAADALGAQMVKTPRYLASALEKISRDQLPLPQASRSTAHLFFSNPFKGEDFIERLVSTHPPIEERIKVLTGTK